MTLFLSEYLLDRAAFRALRITDTYSLHRVVYDLFADVRTDAQKAQSAFSGLQWADKGAVAQGRRLLILSDRPPQPPQYGWLRTRPVPEQFLAASHYRFTVCLNPTQRDKQTGKLRPVQGREAIHAWFCRRAPQWGFHVEPRQIAVPRVQVQHFSGKAHSAKAAPSPITLQQAVIAGRLSVTDPTRFAASFQRGLGRGRAFGCGLLELAPLTAIHSFN